ncbi:YheC/YheD family protein [Priestia koreensis]|uniref:YheC/YheD family endospore coat-associated protein n=1 Tax=Priestia koreensis TaxID=284581 RepID=UPI0028F73560|nr:YheC/YheD family protein [Priestia koreensis]
MTMLKVLVDPIDAHISKAFVSKKLLEHLGNVEKALIRCGAEATSLTIEAFEAKTLQMKCSSTLLKQFHLPVQKQYLLFSVYDGELIVAPVITILTEVYTQEESPYFGSIHAFCEEFFHYCQHEGIFFYVCTTDSSKQGSEEWQGYVCTEEGNWELALVPRPHIVHNRIHSRKRERSEDFKQFVHVLEEQQIPYFNGHYLNKWEVYEGLSTVVHLHPHLPKTYQLSSKDTLIDVLANHPTVFIKPIHGSQGRNIFKVSQKDHSYFLDYTTFNQTLNKEYASFYDLFHALYHHLKKQGFIVQEAIELKADQHGRPFDFRLLCHRNKQGLWKVTSSVARISSEHTFVSNLAQGGAQIKALQLLKDLYDEKTALHLLLLMRELALDICQELSTNQSKIFGEFGIDLALDQEGHPWIIEVNTKPSKQLYQDANKVRPSTKALLEYCLYLFQASDC